MLRFLRPLRQIRLPSANHTFIDLASSYRMFSLINAAKMRNIGISAHIDSGKTTFTERVLFYTGRIGKIHEVRGSDGVGAKMDSMQLEREKGITIQSAATHCKWGDKHINIIDTPGHVDFTVEVERALRVLDGAVLLICGASGVQPQTLTVFKQMKRYNVPRIVFINKLDRLGANPWLAIEQVQSKLQLPCAAVQIPIGIQASLQGLVDLVANEAVYFEGSSGENLVRKPIPQNLQQEAETKRQELVETLAGIDPEIQQLFFNQEKPTTEQLKAAIRRQTISLKFSPIFMGSAFKNKGVQLAIDGVIDYLPQPDQKENHALDISEQEQKEVPLQINNKKPFVGLAFKLEENQFGQLTYIRIYQGKVKKGDIIYNANTQKKVKVSRMVRMHSNEMEDINEAGAGDIFALFGVDCASGETFTSGQKISLRSMHVPEPVMSLNIKPSNNQDLERFMNALNRFTREDPTFTAKHNPESQEMIMSGMGELHLQIYAERMRREYGIGVKVGHPTVNYRETISKRANFNYLHKKQTGGAGQYAKIIGYVEPIPEEENPSRSCEFVDKTEGMNIPGEYIPAIEKAFYEEVKKGPNTGYPVISMRFVLQDGQTHVVDSSSMAFMTATRYAFKKAFLSAQPLILEPIMSVTVQVPAQYQSSIMGTLVRRQGSVTKTESNLEFFSISADVPLSQMFGYATELRGETQGMGQFSMQYIRHEPVNPFQAEKIIEKFKQKQREETAE